jgi:hypothetical protein
MSSLPISTSLSLIVFFFFWYSFFVVFFLFSHTIHTFAVPKTIPIVAFAVLFVHGLGGGVMTTTVRVSNYDEGGV